MVATAWTPVSSGTPAGAGMPARTGRLATGWTPANSRDTSNNLPKQFQRKKLICVKTLMKLPELTVPVEGPTIHVQNLRTSRHSARVGTHTLNEGLT